MSRTQKLSFGGNVELHLGQKEDLKKIAEKLLFGEVGREPGRTGQGGGS